MLKRNVVKFFSRGSGLFFFFWFVLIAQHALAATTVSNTATATNNGPTAANNAVLRDAPGPGLDCTAPSIPAVCTASSGASCPGGVSFANLASPGGVTIPVFPSGGRVTVTFRCKVTATGRP